MASPFTTEWNSGYADGFAGRPPRRWTVLALHYNQGYQAGVNERIAEGEKVARMTPTEREAYETRGGNIFQIGCCLAPAVALLLGGFGYLINATTGDYIVFTIIGVLLVIGMGQWWLKPPKATVEEAVQDAKKRPPR